MGKTNDKFHERDVRSIRFLFDSVLQFGIFFTLISMHSLIAALVYVFCILTQIHNVYNLYYSYSINVIMISYHIERYFFGLFYIISEFFGIMRKYVDLESRVVENHRLNVNANIFCPSKNNNSIIACNRFPKDLNVIYCNLQGMLEGCHFDELKNEISKTNNIHIIAITETWLRNRINANKTIEIAGFKVLRSDRRSSDSDANKGGGVMLYAKQSMRTKIIARSFDDKYNIAGVEFIFVECVMKRGIFAVAVVYRTNLCSTVNTERLFKTLIELSTTYSDVLIVGDFNINIMNNTGRIGMMKDHFKIVNHSCPTHRWPNATPTLIDIAFTKNLSQINFYGHYNLIPATHHDLLIISYRGKMMSDAVKARFSYRDYKGINIDNLNEDAGSVDWSDLYFERDIEQKIRILDANYVFLFEKSVPLITVKLSHKPKSWFTGELNQLMNERKISYDSFNKCKDPQSRANFWEEYLALNKRVKNSINFLKQDDFSNKFRCAETSKEKWSVIKTTGCSKEKESLDLNEDVTLNDLNEFYLSIHKSSIMEMPIASNRTIHSDFDFRQFTHWDIVNAVRSIKSGAIGADNISIRFLKLVLPYFIDPMLHIFNYSLEKSIFPHAWNLIKIRPIKKIPSPKAPVDTRPITINSIYTKIMTMMLNSQLKLYIEENEILSPYQSGFRDKHSCTTALMRVSEDIRMSIARGEVTILVLLDIRSAYPSVSHDLLLHVLKSIGMRNESLNWTNSFISNKSEFVEVDGKRSNTIKIGCGLLQGDNLSQTFFSLIINGVVDSIHDCKYHLYADDQSIYFHTNADNFERAIEIVNSDVGNVNEWMTNHGMFLNPGKTQCIVIGSQRNLNKIDIANTAGIIVDGIPIKFSKKVKYL